MMNPLELLNKNASQDRQFLLIGRALGISVSGERRIDDLLHLHKK